MQFVVMVLRRRWYSTQHPAVLPPVPDDVVTELWYTCQTADASLERCCMQTGGEGCGGSAAALPVRLAGR